MRVMDSPIATVGVPTALGGELPSEADTTQIKIDIERKDGKGGFR